MHHLITSPISSLSYQSQYLETRVNSFIDDLDRDRCHLYNLGKMNLLGT